MEERVRQIYRCMKEIEKCEQDIKAGKLDMAGPWLGYMDWLEELHYQVHNA